MTGFKELELIYSQFFSLTNEINNMIENEDYLSAVANLEHKDKLMNQILMAKKTLDCTVEEKEKLRSVEKKILDSENKVLESLKKLRSEVEETLNITKKKVKLNSAYSIRSGKQGRIIDTSE